MQKQSVKNLKFRYLLWLYKTTRETLEKIERKFTQLVIDRQLAKDMLEAADSAQVKDQSRLRRLLKEWQDYIARKEKDGLSLKYDGKKLKPDYYFLTLKLQAIEKSIVKQLGQRAKNEIKSLYEQEMKKRILESREHN